MPDAQLGRFFKHSAVYAVGNLIYRGGAFLLIPLYVNVLSPSEYGTVELYYLTSSIFQLLFASGVAHASLRYYFEYDRDEDRNAVISTALIGSFFVMSVGAGALWFAAPGISQLLFATDTHILALRLVLCSIVLETSREINLAFLRARERSGFYVVVAITQLVVQVGANVTTVVVLQMGVLGIVIGNLIATVSVWALLSVSFFRNHGWQLKWALFRPVLVYGAPLMLSGITEAILRSSDRYLLNVHAGLATIGLYALALRFAQLPMTFVLDPFTKSFGPFRFAIMDRADAAETYSQILRYYLFVASLVFVGLSAFSGELVQLVSASSYQSAAAIVPLVLIAPTIRGVNYVMQTGIYISKQTKYIFYINAATGLLLLGLNFTLIPRWGVYGAAIAVAISWIVKLTLTHVTSQRVHPITYDFSGTPKIVVLAIAATIAALGLPEMHFALLLGLKLTIVAAYVRLAIPLDPGQKLGDLVKVFRRTEASSVSPDMPSTA